MTVILPPCIPSGASPVRRSQIAPCVAVYLDHSAFHHRACPWSNVAINCDLAASHFFSEMHANVSVNYDLAVLLGGTYSANFADIALYCDCHGFWSDSCSVCSILKSSCSFRCLFPSQIENCSISLTVFPSRTCGVMHSAITGNLKIFRWTQCYHLDARLHGDRI